MDELFQRSWFGRYWMKLLMSEHLLWIVIALVILFVFFATRISRRR